VGFVGAHVSPPVSRSVSADDGAPAANRRTTRTSVGYQVAPASRRGTDTTDRTNKVSTSRESIRPDRRTPTPGSRARPGLARALAVGATALVALCGGVASASATETAAQTDPDVAMSRTCDVAYTVAYYSWITTGHTHIESMGHAERTYTACDYNRKTRVTRVTPVDLPPIGDHVLVPTDVLPNPLPRLP
jgi:hypothetical protein